MSKKSLKTQIGENIRRERIARNISIENLAEILELTPGSVGLIERGRRGATLITLYRISKLFNMPAAELVSVDSIPQTSLIPLDYLQQDALRYKREVVKDIISEFSDKELNFAIAMIKLVRNIK